MDLKKLEISLEEGMASDSKKVEATQSQLDVLQKALETSAANLADKRGRLASLRMLREASMRNYVELDMDLPAIPKLYRLDISEYPPHAPISSPIDLSWDMFEGWIKGFDSFVKYFGIATDTVFPNAWKAELDFFGTYAGDGESNVYIPADGYFFIDEYSEYFPQRFDPVEILHFLVANITQDCWRFEKYEAQDVDSYSKAIGIRLWNILNLFRGKTMQAVVSHEDANHLVSIKGLDVEGGRGGFKIHLTVEKIWKDTKIYPSYFFKKR